MKKSLKSKDIELEIGSKNEDLDKVMSYIIMNMAKKDSTQFYSYILSYFSFKYVKNGTERPDFDLGAIIEKNKVTFVINPFIFLVKSETEMEGRLIHEIDHVLKGDIHFDYKNSNYKDVITTVHTYRKEDGSEEIYKKKTPLANVAMDLSINSLKFVKDKDYYSNKEYFRVGSDYLLKEGIFPSEGLFKSLTPQRPWEEYYEALYEYAEQGLNGFSLTSSGDAESDEISFDWNQRDGVPETSFNNSWVNGGSEDSSLSEIEKETFTSFMFTLISEAADKAGGNIPGHYKTYLDKFKTVKKNWKTVLNRYIASSVTQDIRTTKRKIHKRAISLKAFMPGYIAVKGVKVCIFVDSSGSMSQDQYCNILNHANKIRTSTGAEVWIGVFDARVYDFYELKKYNYRDILANKLTKSNGGTKFCPIFTCLEDKKIVPDVCAIFTDGYNFDENDMKNVKPKFKVLWVYPSKHKEQKFGNHLVLSTEEF